MFFLILLISTSYVYYSFYFKKKFSFAKFLVFLLAYMNGNAELCKAAIGYGICLAVTNYNGVSIFNFETPTKQLLFALLGYLL